MSDRHLFLLNNFYVGSDNVRCPTVILSTAGTQCPKNNFVQIFDFLKEEVFVFQKIIMGI